MQIIEFIKSKLSERHADAQSKYWALVQRIATDSLSERAAKSAAEEMEASMPALNKSPDDVQRDIDTMAEVNSTTALASKRVQNQAALKAVIAAGVEVETQAKQLEARAKALRAKHAEEVGKAKAALRATDGAAARLQELRRRLAVAGCPEFVGLIEQREHQREVDRVANDLAAAEREVAEAEQAVATFPERLLTGHVDSALAGSARRAARQLDVARHRRDQLAKQLAELHGGAKVDAGEDVTDQILAEEVTP